ncbi:MAG TPA: CBS domain-containing protein [Clostridia bacterium]|nr:CBS domain-containing protein [Clostridia bacterium]
MPTLALSDLLGLPVYDSAGGKAGRVREVALVPQEDQNHVSAFVVRTLDGDRLLSTSTVKSLNGGIRSTNSPENWAPYGSSEGMLLLERDLLDQQIIDVHGRKVVRVNDVDLLADTGAYGSILLRIGAVDVGARGAVRRLLKNVVPNAALRPLLAKIPPKMIPWEFVNLIETDPARRVRLKISSDRISKLHPADIADIIEELAPAERDAVFQGLDEETAAHALEEIDPKLQISLVSSLDNDRAADIVEEMDPDAAADLLGDLPREQSEQILEEMQPEEREEVEELLEFEEDTAAGRMTTDYMALSPHARVSDAVEMMRNFEGGLESMSTVFLVGDAEKLVGAVPLAKLVLAAPDTRLAELAAEPLISCSPEADEKEVAEIFDKYNLLTLPVVDETGALTGVITADDVISILRSKL